MFGKKKQKLTQAEVLRAASRTAEAADTLGHLAEFHDMLDASMQMRKPRLHITVSDLSKESWAVLDGHVAAVVLGVLLENRDAVDASAREFVNKRMEAM